jgi:hypothetical protein
MAIMCICLVHIRVKSKGKVYFACDKASSHESVGRVKV